MEYKFVTVVQTWKMSVLEEKANTKANELAREGWRLTHMRQGWNGFLFSTLYLAFERPITQS